MSKLKPLENFVLITKPYTRLINPAYIKEVKKTEDNKRANLFLINGANYIITREECPDNEFWREFWEKDTRG